MRVFLSAMAAIGMLAGAPVASASEAAVSAISAPEPLTFQMSGANRQALTGTTYIIPTYHLNFITSQQATSVMSIGSRARLAMVLQGVDDAVMRRLADEAYADLRQQLEAAGLTVMSVEETRALTQAAGYQEIPGNLEAAGVGGGPTVGSSVRKGWVIVGPQAAPALRAYNTMSQGGMGALMPLAGNISAGNAFNRRPEAANATILVPSVTIDFAQMEAARGGMFGGAARASGQATFGVPMTSPVQFNRPTGRMGTSTPGSMRPRADVWSRTAFAEVVEGGAAVRTSATLSPTVDDNYNAVVRARGDAVVVNLPVWEGLVRDAYRGYNASIVQAIKGR